MSGHAEVQIIEQGGKPAFAVVPYDRWLELIGEQDEDVYLPHEVVGYQVKEGLSLIAAWRKYKGISQTIVADRLGISQPAMAQIEKVGSRPQERTLVKVAAALGVTVTQLRD